jgi:hypothetical protein
VEPKLVALVQGRQASGQLGSAAEVVLRTSGRSDPERAHEALLAAVNRTEELEALLA